MLYEGITQKERGVVRTVFNIREQYGQAVYLCRGPASNCRCLRGMADAAGCLCVAADGDQLDIGQMVLDPDLAL